MRQPHAETWQRCLSVLTIYLAATVLSEQYMGCQLSVYSLFKVITTLPGTDPRLDRYLFHPSGILVVRVFYLFSHSLIARIIITSSYIASIIVTIVLEYSVFHGRSLLTPLDTLGTVVHLVGCPVHPMTRFWNLFLPAFSLHTILYIFTLIRVLSCEDSPQALLIKRLHRE